MLTAAAPNIADRHLSAVGDEAWFARWRNVELSRLESSGTTYLDYTGAALYPESLIRRDADRLLGSVLGNPHSESAPSRLATEDLDEARAAILAYLNADPGEYIAVLTPNATAACRLVGEAFRFEPAAALVLAADNHNSVNGLREFARRAGSAVCTVPVDADLRLEGADRILDLAAGTRPGLFAFPAQSNFSGVRHPLTLIAGARARGFRVLLDAASFVPTSLLDLSVIAPDFIALSVYKIAGYPTGIGALVARREAIDELRRPWFSGGTVDWVTIGSSRHQLRTGPGRFEDGTPPFLAAGAVRSALAAVVYADRERLARHLRALTESLLAGLGNLNHVNGAALVTIHGPTDATDRGPTVAITLRNRTGGAIPYWEVEASARERRIALRGGCFCNPGCAESAFDLQVADECLDRMGRDFSIPALAACLDDRPVGALRLSMGLGSVHSDIDVALDFLSGFLS